MADSLLKVCNLNVDYVQKTGFFSKHTIHAVRNVSLNVSAGEIVGVVGESGSGKSTLARAILRLMNVSAGEIYFRGQAIHNLNNRQMRRFRQSMQMVFQDPLSSINPRMKISQVIAEPLQQFHSELSPDSCQQEIEQVIQKVELPGNVLNHYAHQLSGGQCQRVSIARALICKPELVVCDEAVSALDVSVQAQILNLLRSLSVDANMALLFISHDLRVIRQLCDRVLVMYQGQLVESASCDNLFERPEHAYTRKLFAAIPQALVD